MGEGRQVRNPITGWWENLSEPRWVTPLIVLFYGLMCAAGIAALGPGPRFLEVGLGSVLMVYWAGLLIGGGAVGVFAAVYGWNVLERLALIAIGTAVALYIGTTFSLQNETAQNLLWRVLLDCGLVVHLGIRWLRVRYGLRDPERYSTYKPPTPPAA